ncbi:MAG: hypothetical protein WD845_16380 [Pirellulales bacterium]
MVIASVVACVVMATARSNGLVAVTVTATDPKAEPVDHVLPLVKQHESLPDYELVIEMTRDRTQYLGTKPNESAVNGLSWRLNDPVSLAEIATVRLREKDKVISDELAEVHVTAASVTSNGYRFDFQTTQSFGLGVRAFFVTPIGMAISGAFFLGVLLLVVSKLA